MAMRTARFRVAVAAVAAPSRAAPIAAMMLWYPVRLTGKVSVNAARTRYTPAAAAAMGQMGGRIRISQAGSRSAGMRGETMATTAAQAAIGMAAVKAQRRYWGSLYST